jgi:hypothetical protein
MDGTMECGKTEQQEKEAVPMAYGNDRCRWDRLERIFLNAVVVTANAPALHARTTVNGV